MVDGIRADLDGWMGVDYIKHIVESAGGWRFSWDNAGQHKFSAEMLQARGMQWVPLPPYSPDLHRVVEHAVGRTWRAFLKARRGIPKSAKPDEYMDVLVDCFQEANTSPTVASDVMGLPEVYKVISSPLGADCGKYLGSAGDWPHPRLYH